MWNYFQNIGVNDENNSQQSQLVSFPLAEFMKVGQNISILPLELRHLFQTLFNDKKEVIKLSQILPFKTMVTPVPFCNKKIGKKDIRFRCFDCLIREGFILCQDCFKKGQHKGHRYIQTQDQGMCDCGNKQLMKQQNFCPNHSGVEIAPKISEQLEFMFKLLIKQVFIWVFYLYSYDHAKESLQLLEHLIIYIQHLNQSSLFYNSLTTFILFADQEPLIHHLFNITLAQTENRCYQLLADLLLEMLRLSQFCEKMIVAFLLAYTNISRFQQSKYEKLFYNHLITDSGLIERVMTKNPIPFLPCLPKYNPKVYFQHLYLAAITLSPAATSAFLQPVLSRGQIKLPFLDEIMRECQQKDTPIINVFTAKYMQQEFLYYKLMMAIISKQSKTVLKGMLLNYYKMTLHYPFSKSKIILVPQRIFIMLIYKYYNFDLQQIDCQQLAQILEVSIDNFFEIMARLGLSFVNCLGEFAANISRTTYFDNYLPVYLKDSQIVLVDYLAIKIIAMITTYIAEGHFAHIIIDMYDKQVNSHLLVNKDEETKELVRKWNNMIKIFVQICVSPRTEMVVSSFMGVKPNFSISKQLLIAIFNRNEEASMIQLEYIKILFFGKKLSKTILDQSLVFNKKSKKFTLLEDVKDTNNYSLNAEWFVSLLKSNLNKLVTRQLSNSKQSQFTKQETKMFQLLMRISFVQQLILKQFKVICQSQSDFMILLPELIVLAKSLRKIIGEECLNRLFERIILYAIQKSEIQIITSRVNLHKTKMIDVEQVKEMIYSQENNRLNQPDKLSREVNRKRQLLKHRKIEKLKQMKLNQQKILANYEQQPQNSEQVCLICKQSSNRNELCYIGRLKNTNMLFTLLQMPGYNLIFYSCFHTVHFSCFMDLRKIQHVVFCPLCKIACNTVFPIEFTFEGPLLAIINIQMEMTMRMATKAQAKQILMEGVKYFGYLILIMMNSKTEIIQKQIKLCQLIYALMKHNHYCQGDLFDFNSASAELYPHQYDKNQVQFDFKTFIQIVFKIVIERIQHEEIAAEKIAEQIILLYQFMSKDQVMFMIQILDRILPATGEQSALQNILKELQSQPSAIIKQFNSKLYLFFTPPKTINDLLTIRDEFLDVCKEKKLNHHVCICIICKKGFCKNCGQAKKHTFNYHKRQCLFFNTQTGGLNYFCGESQLYIRSLYTNQSGEVWHSEQKSSGYTLDESLYEQVLNGYKIGNLYYFLTHAFDGLKDQDLHDRI